MVRSSGLATTRFSVATCVIITASVLLAACMLSVTVQEVSAHKPIFEGSEASGYGAAVEIPDPEVSWAVYGYLNSGEDTDYYYFDLHAPLNLYTGILVPEKTAYANFSPSYAIVGPGLTRHTDMPFPLPAGAGAMMIDSWSDQRDIFYEPFTGISYYRGNRTRTMLTEPGRYYLVVFDRNHMRGDYVLAVGEKEVFSAGDLPGVIAAVAKIRSGGVDHSGSV